jgi:hypothetical protein
MLPTLQASVAYASSRTDYCAALDRLNGLLMSKKPGIETALNTLTQKCQEYINAASVWCAQTMLSRFGRRSVELIRMKSWYGDNKDSPVNVALRIEDIDIPLAINLHSDFCEIVSLLRSIGVPLVFSVPIGKSKPERFSTFCVTQLPHGMSAVCCVASTLCCIFANLEVCHPHR